MAWPLVPMVKYDSRFAQAIGKWMLNVTNAARLSYPYEIDDAHQWLPGQKELTKNVIAYEGIRKTDDYGQDRLKGVSPVAIGDGPKWVENQPKVSMYSLYSSGLAGIFGAIVRKTNVDKILQLNCNATDFYQARKFPEFLYYNPYDSEQTIIFEQESSEAVDLYDVLSHEMLVVNSQQGAQFTIPAKGARLLVVLPANSEVSRDGDTYTVNGITVAYAPTNSNQD